MRLIDADAFKSQIAGMSISNNYPANKANALCELIDAQPAAYNPDKVVAQLEEVEKIMTSPVNNDCFGEECRASDCTVCLISKAIEIVKSGEVDAKTDS